MSVGTVADQLTAAAWPSEFAVASVAPHDATPAAQHHAGRRAALAALRLAGNSIDGLPPKIATLPQWPAGFVGSIAHDATRAVAVVASRAHAHAIGIDVERHDALDPLDATLVLTDDERTFAGTDRSHATLLWSAKESAYKAWCGAMGDELDGVDPRDIAVTVLATSSLHIVARGALEQRVSSIGVLDGGWTRVDDHVLTLAWKLASSSA